MKIELDVGSTILGIVLGIIAVCGLGAAQIINENNESPNKEEA